MLCPRKVIVMLIAHLTLMIVDLHQVSVCFWVATRSPGSLRSSMSCLAQVVRMNTEAQLLSQLRSFGNFTAQST